MEGTDAGTEGLVVEPGRLLEVLEEIAQGLRRGFENVIAPLDAGADEAVQFAGRHRGEFLHDRIQFRIADARVLDVVVDSLGIGRPSRPVTLRVRRRNVHWIRASWKLSFGPIRPSG